MTKKIIVIGAEIPIEVAQTLAETHDNICVLHRVIGSEFTDTEPMMFDNPRMYLPEVEIDEDFVKQARKHDTTCDKNRAKRKRKNKNRKRRR